VHGGFAKHGKLAVPWLNVLRSLASRERVDLTPFKNILKVCAIIALVEQMAITN